MKPGNQCVCYVHQTGAVMPSVSSKKAIKDLQAAGWHQVARRGSHVQLKHAEKTGRITVPHPKRDLPLGTAKAIYDAAGLPLPWK